MKGLLSPLGCVRHGKAKKYMPWTQKYKLTTPLTYKTKRGEKIVVPTGFITNFATWIKPRGLYEIAAVIHDFLYEQQAGRHYADRIFNEVMRRAGCSQARINIMYYGVRLFGWIAYWKLGRKKK